MDISITSTHLISFKPIQFSSARTLQTRSKPNIISCRATTASGKNLYKVLSLDSENVGFDEIKKAYRSMALRYHPDVCPPSRKEEFTKMFVELHRAYETLSDPILRRNYDYELGLRDIGKTYRSRGRMSGFSRERWKDQLAQLKVKSDRRMKQKQGWTDRNDEV